MARLTKEQREQLNDRDWLYDVYIVQNKRVQEIADMFGIHKSSVEKTVSKLGIKKSQKQSKALMKKTNLERYGFTTATQAPEIKEKTIQNNVKKYNRMKCQANMDERKLREREYANEIGTVKIFDAGQRVYIKHV